MPGRKPTRRALARISLLLAVVPGLLLVQCFASDPPLDVEPPDLSFCPYLVDSASKTACPLTGNPARSGRKDPVNLLFRGVGSAEELEPLFREYLGWERRERAADLYFIDQGEAGRQDLHLAGPSGHESGSSSGHARLKEGDGYVLAAVHHDHGIIHVGAHFDELRDEVAEAFASHGHVVEEMEIGNTLPTHQFLAPDTASLDGVIAVIEITPEVP